MRRIRCKPRAPPPTHPRILPFGQRLLLMHLQQLQTRGATFARSHLFAWPDAVCLSGCFMRAARGVHRAGYRAFEAVAIAYLVGLTRWSSLAEPMSKSYKDFVVAVLWQLCQSGRPCGCGLAYARHILMHEDIQLNIDTASITYFCTRVSSSLNCSNDRFTLRVSLIRVWSRSFLIQSLGPRFRVPGR